MSEGGKAAGAREYLRVQERGKTFRGIQRKIAGAREYKNSRNLTQN